MIGSVELALNLWLFGAPVVLIAWSVLRLSRRAPARVRYVLAILGFVSVLVVPLIGTRRMRGPLQATGGAAGASTGIDFVGPAASVLPIVWIAGSLLLVMRDAAGHIALRRARRTWSDAPDALKDVLEWPRRVPLLVAADTAPMTVGLLRPTVVLPRDLVETFPVNVLRRIARHELSHATWRDPLVYAVLRLAAALFWLAPVWPLLRWTRREREAAADEMALRGAAGEEEHYVAALLRLARSAFADVPAMAGSDLEYRARRILTPAPRFSIAASIALAIGCALLASATPVDFGEERVVLAVPRARRLGVVGVGVGVVRASGAPQKRAGGAHHTNTPTNTPIQTPTQTPTKTLAQTPTKTGLPLPTRSLSAFVPFLADQTTVDVHQHVDVDRHVADDGVRRVEKDNQRIRIVIRDRD